MVSTVAMSARDAAALGSTLLTLGERTETAGTAANAMVQKFAAAEKGTKKFQSAVREIGLDSVAIQRGMASDATGTLMTVIEAIRKLPKDKQIGVMVELVGMEHSDTLAKLVDKPEEFRRQLELANGTGAQGSMRREFSARTDTQSAKLQTTKNRAFNLSAALGKTLNPTLDSLKQMVDPLLERLLKWVEENPRLVGAIMQLALFLAALVAIIGALTLAAALFIGKMMLTRFVLAQFASVAGPLANTALKVLSSSFTAVGRAILFVGRAMLANPILLVIAAIAVAAFLIYKYWGPIKQFVVDLWGTVSSYIVGTWMTITEAFDSAWQKVADATAALWTDVKSRFNAGIDWLMALPAKFATFGGDIIQGLANGITGALGAVKEAITNAASATLNWFKEKLGIRSPSRVFMEAGTEIGNGTAIGIASRGAHVRRAALGVAAAAASVLPIAATGADGGLRIDARPPISAGTGSPMAVGGDTITIQIHAAPGMDPQAIARAVSAELDRRQRAKRAGMMSALADLD